MDKEILERFLNSRVQIVNDENFVINGRIIEIYNNTVAVFSDGKTRYLSFDRIKEIRPLGGDHFDY